MSHYLLRADKNDKIVVSCCVDMRNKLRCDGVSERRRGWRVTSIVNKIEAMGTRGKIKMHPICFRISMCLTVSLVCGYHFHNQSFIHNIVHVACI